MGVLVAPEAAGGAASLAYMVLALTALLGYCIARGLLACWTHSIGYMLNWLAGELKFSVSLGFTKASVDLGGPFRTVDRLVITALQDWAAGLEAEVGYFWHGSATIAEWTAGQVSGLAHDTADTFEWLIHAHLPKISGQKISETALRGLIAKMIADAIPKVWPKITKLTHVIEHTITHTVTKVISSAGAIPIPNPWAFPRFHHWWHDLTKWREVTAKRLARLEKLLGVAGMAAVMANVLGLPNWRCLTRGNIGKTARHLCGLSPRALQDILGLLTDLLILADICHVIQLLEGGLSLVEPEITAFITGAEAVACYGTNAGPAALPLTPLALPAAPSIALALP